MIPGRGHADGIEDLASVALSELQEETGVKRARLISDNNACGKQRLMMNRRRINMFWDNAAGLYDLFENIYNGKVNRQLCVEVAELMEQSDKVLECACGTGMITKSIAPKCSGVIATDFSVGMLKQAKKNCKAFPNVTIKQGNIMQLEYEDETFDKVVAGNVIHLLDEPYVALAELDRVCKTGGQIIIPTYVNNENAGKPGSFVKIIEKFGAGFKCQFNYKSYQEFFAKAGYDHAEYKLVQGKMPCAIAVIMKR